MLKTLQRGHIDIEYDELVRYFVAARKKVGTCEVIPAGRFAFRLSAPRFDGLVCSDFVFGGQEYVETDFLSQYFGKITYRGPETDCCWFPKYRVVGRA